MLQKRAVCWPGASWGRDLVCHEGFSTSSFQLHIPKDWVRIELVIPAFFSTLLWNPKSLPALGFTPELRGSPAAFPAAFPPATAQVSSQVKDLSLRFQVPSSDSAWPKCTWMGLVAPLLLPGCSQEQKNALFLYLWPRQTPQGWPLVVNETRQKQILELTPLLFVLLSNFMSQLHPLPNQCPCPAWPFVPADLSYSVPFLFDIFPALSSLHPSFLLLHPSVVAPAS